MRVDEPERIGLQGVVDQLDRVLVLSDIALAGGVVDDHRVDVVVDERLDGQGELVERLDPGLTDQLGGQDFVGGAHLSGHDRVRVVDQRLGRRVPVVVDTDDEHLLHRHVRIGVVHDLLALVGDRDAVGGRVQFAWRKSGTQFNKRQISRHTS